MTTPVRAVKAAVRALKNDAGTCDGGVAWACAMWWVAECLEAANPELIDQLMAVAPLDITAFTTDGQDNDNW